MPRQISEQLMRGKHAHKEMIDPQLEHAGWYLHDHAEEQAKEADYAK